MSPTTNELFAARKPIARDLGNRRLPLSLTTSPHRDNRAFGGALAWKRDADACASSPLCWERVKRH
jgi:hypothetical protein